MSKRPPLILPGLKFRWRKLKNGSERWEGTVVEFGNYCRIVAKVTANSQDELRARVYAVTNAFRALVGAEPWTTKKTK